MKSFIKFSIVPALASICLNNWTGRSKGLDNREYRWWSNESAWALKLTPIYLGSCVLDYIHFSLLSFNVKRTRKVNIARIRFKTSIFFWMLQWMDMQITVLNMYHCMRSLAIYHFLYDLNWFVWSYPVFLFINLEW